MLQFKCWLFYSSRNSVNEYEISIFIFFCKKRSLNYLLLLIILNVVSRRLGETVI